MTRPDESIDFSARNVLYNLGDILLVQTEDSIWAGDKLYVRRRSGHPRGAWLGSAYERCCGSVRVLQRLHPSSVVRTRRGAVRADKGPRPVALKPRPDVYRSRGMGSSTINTGNQALQDMPSVPDQDMRRRAVVAFCQQVSPNRAQPGGEGEWQAGED